MTDSTFALYVKKSPSASTDVIFTFKTGGEKKCYKSTTVSNADKSLLILLLLRNVIWCLSLFTECLPYLMLPLHTSCIFCSEVMVGLTVALKLQHSAVTGGATES